MGLGGTVETKGDCRDLGGGVDPTLKGGTHVQSTWVGSCNGPSPSIPSASVAFKVFNFIAHHGLGLSRNHTHSLLLLECANHTGTSGPLHGNDHPSVRVKLPCHMADFLTHFRSLL